MFCQVSAALEDIANGIPVIVVDDEDRENEGDFFLAADKITPQGINFMAVHGRGLICTPVSADIANRLRFHPMVPDADPNACNFSVSVDLRVGITTGISAEDRAKTIARICQEEARAEDFVRPGHIFPLIAKDGGVLVRAGHTEASVDLCLLAKLHPVGVICEIMNTDGSMARMPDLKKIAQKQNVKILTIAELIRFRKKNEQMVTHIAQANLPSEYGDFTIHVFADKLSGHEHVALVKGTVDDGEPVLLRAHSECLTGDSFGSQLCDCGPQLHVAMMQIQKEGRGVVLYMRQEGRGIGLGNKIKAYGLQQQQGVDTVEANHLLGFTGDLRDYGIGAQILVHLGIKKIKLLTNNPKKVSGISGYGLEIVERLPLQIPEHEHNRAYLQTKKEKLGHLLQ